ncbi:hypothetical protein BD626DRAFT_508714 [Schizophyllum amplum]|uniref:Copper transporter n=1 Tax=Schizophyllum amplum TaxID=97359 RepID=A0A550C3A6_9AGAR|nr:hypothetical protein BD626DRAFT_508714 [Auriculariopsis ampla]
MQAGSRRHHRISSLWPSLCLAPMSPRVSNRVVTDRSSLLSGISWWLPATSTMGLTRFNAVFMVVASSIVALLLIAMTMWVFVEYVHRLGSAPLRRSPEIGMRVLNVHDAEKTAESLPASPRSTFTIGSDPFRCINRAMASSPQPHAHITGVVKAPARVLRKKSSRAAPSLIRSGRPSTTATNRWSPCSPLSRQGRDIPWFRLDDKPSEETTRYEVYPSQSAPTGGSLVG